MPMILADNQFGTGAMPEKPGKHSLLWEPEAGSNGETVDLNHPYSIEEELGGKLRVKDQRSSLSCTGQTTAYYTHVLQIKEMAALTGMTLDELRENQPQIVEELSAKVPYSQTYLPNGGAYTSASLYTAINYGMLAERVVPSYHDNGDTSEEFLRSQAWKDLQLDYLAAQLKNKALAWVWPLTMENIIAAIRKNGGVAISLGGSNNGTWRTLRPKPPKGQPEWYHAMYFGASGVNENGLFVSSPNSWGDLGGWQEFGEEWLPHITSVLTLIDRPSHNTVRLYRLSTYDKLIDGSPKPIHRDIPVNQKNVIQSFLEQGWSFTKIPNSTV